jgi:translation initiation factor 2 subunit 1
MIGYELNFIFRLWLLSLACSRRLSYSVVHRSSFISCCSPTPTTTSIEGYELIPDSIQSFQYNRTALTSGLYNTKEMSEEAQNTTPSAENTTTTTTTDEEETTLFNEGTFRLYLGKDKKNLECRFYENQYPEIESVVMVNVRNIADMGAYVSLLEYNNIEGMILLSELSRRRIRSINKLIRVGRNEVVMVLRVDQEKGYIDLSKRRVTPEDVAACEDRFNKAKAVHGVLRHLADRRGLYLEELYKQIGWPLYRKYGHAYDAFKLALSEEDCQDDPFQELEIPQEIKDELKAYIRRRLAPQPVKIRADIEVSCFAYEGIDAIREALYAGIACGSENTPIKIKLIAPPIYVMSTTTLDKDAGIALLNKAIDTITEVITSKGGKLDIKMAAKAVSIKEETELQAMMDRLALENVETDGDAPEDE